MHWLGEANIAVASLGCGGFDANRDEISLLSQLISQANRLSERFYMVNDCVCGKQGHHGLGIVAGNSCRCPANRGSCIAPHRFFQDMLLWKRWQVFLHQFRHASPGDNPGVVRCYQRLNACQRLLNHAIAVGQRQELFGEVWGAQGP